MARERLHFSDPHFDLKHNILINTPGFTDTKKLDRFGGYKRQRPFSTCKSIQERAASMLPTCGRFIIGSSRRSIPGPASYAKSIYIVQRPTPLP